MWDKCGRPASMPDGSTIWIGVDAATHRDSFGVSWVRVDTEMVEDQETGLFKPTQVAHIKVKAFLPASEGEYIDQEEVRTFIMGLAARYRVESLLYDPAYMGLMAQQLEDAGVVCEPYPQSGEKMVFASETFQRLVLNCQLRHGKDRVLDEQLSAVGTRETERGVRVSKAKSGARIDVVVALVMALAGAMGDEGGGDFAMLM
jgi:phage terminase large subunit-like protein